MIQIVAEIRSEIQCECPCSSRLVPVSPSNSDPRGPQLKGVDPDDAFSGIPYVFPGCPGLP